MSKSGAEILDWKIAAAANAELWNDSSVTHLAEWYDVEAFRKGGNNLDAIQRSEVGDVTDKRLLHLQCNAGLDTLSWARLGATATGVDIAHRPLETARGLALTGLGATVTSVDISENQLEVARQRASELDLDVLFIRSDVTHIPELESNQFDLVFMGGVAIFWFSNLEAVCREAARILLPGGNLVIRDHHPFSTIWKKDKSRLEIEYPYFHSGPRVLIDRFGAEHYMYHWTVSDQLKAMIAAGCEIMDVDEWGGETPDHFEDFPGQGLPGSLFIHAQKHTKATVVSMDSGS